jgi:multidrug efflux pump subunit AcrA (membrane-fusion protein)
MHGCRARETPVKHAQAINKSSKFKAGDPLVQLDTTDLDRQIAELERNYQATKERTELLLKDDPREAEVEEKLKTAQRLHALGRVTDEQLKMAQRALDAVRKDLSLTKFDREKSDADHEARMKDLTILRDKMTVPAPPMDGVVQAPLTWEGALIGGNAPVAIVYSNARIVAAKISEEKFGSVKVGQDANLRLLTYGGREFKAKVSTLLPTADETQRFEVWLDVEADPEILLPNSTGEVTITVDKRPNALVIPRRSLINNDTVYVVENGVVRRRTV